MNLIKKDLIVKKLLNLILQMMKNRLYDLLTMNFITLTYFRVLFKFIK